MSSSRSSSFSFRGLAAVLPGSKGKRKDVFTTESEKEENNQLSPFERCNLDTIKLIFDLCDFDSLLNLSLASRGVRNIIEPYVYRTVFFDLVDGPRYMAWNAHLFRTLDREENGHLRDYVREVRVNRGWDKSDTRNLAMLHDVGWLIPKLKNLAVIKTNAILSSTCMTYLKTQPLIKFCYEGKLPDKPKEYYDKVVGPSWHSLATTVNPTSSSSRSALAYTLSLATNLRALSVTFIPETYGWTKAHHDPLHIFTGIKTPRITSLSLQGYHPGCRNDGDDQSPPELAPPVRLLPALTRNLTSLTIDNPLLFNRHPETLHFPTLTSLTIEIYIPHTELWIEHNHKTDPQTLRFFNNSLLPSNPPIKHLTYRYEAAYLASAFWKTMILPFASTLQTLCIFGPPIIKGEHTDPPRDGYIAEDPLAMTSLASACSKLTDLEINVIRDGKSWPKSVFGAITAFAALEGLTLFIPIRHYNRSSRIQPEVNYDSVKDISDFFLKDHGKKFSRLKVVRGTVEVPVCLLRESNTSRRSFTRYREMEGEESEVFEVGYWETEGGKGGPEEVIGRRVFVDVGGEGVEEVVVTVEGVSSEGLNDAAPPAYVPVDPALLDTAADAAVDDHSVVPVIKEEKGTVVNALMVKKLKKAVERTPATDLSYEIALNRLRLCEARARGKLPTSIMAERMGGVGRPANGI